MTHSHAVLAKPAALAGLTPTVILQGGDDTNRTGGSTAYQTAAIGLTAGRLYLLLVTTARSDGSNNGGLSAVQSGATWTTIVGADTGVGVTRSTIFRCQPAANVSAAVISVGQFDAVPVDFTMWSLIEVTGAVLDTAGNGANAIGEKAFSTGGGDSPNAQIAGTLSPPNAQMGFCYHANAGALDPTTGLELSEVALGTRRIAAMWRPGAKGMGTQTNPVTSGTWHAICAEVLAA